VLWTSSRFERSQSRSEIWGFLARVPPSGLTRVLHEPGLWLWHVLQGFSFLSSVFVAVAFLLRCPSATFVLCRHCRGIIRKMFNICARIQCPASA
jgi:hypothetical protein